MVTILSFPIHSPALSIFCLLSLWNCSDFIVSLYQGLNLLFSVLNSPLHISHFSFLARVSVSNNCSPFLPSQFLINAVFSIFGISYDLNTSHRSSLKFYSSLYLSLVSQLSVSCFITGPNLSTMLCLALICSLDIFPSLSTFLYVLC